MAVELPYKIDTKMAIGVFWHEKSNLCTISNLKYASVQMPFQWSQLRSPQFASMLTHLSAAHNPYIGFFLDHHNIKQGQL